MSTQWTGGQGWTRCDLEPCPQIDSCNFPTTIYLHTYIRLMDRRTGQFTMCSESNLDDSLLGQVLTSQFAPSTCPQRRNSWRYSNMDRTGDSHVACPEASAQ